MNLLLTVCLLVIPSACAFAVWRCIVYMDLARGHSHEAEAYALAVREQRDRLTVMEREVEALRRELRKLGGKVHAHIASEQVDFVHDERAHVQARAALCENYALAQVDGPLSAAARCDCQYCSDMRAHRAAARKADLPRARLLTGGKANGSE